MKKDSGDRATKIKTESIGMPNIIQRPSILEKSNPTSKFIDVSPITRKETPSINPRTIVDENTIIDRCLT